MAHMVIESCRSQRLLKGGQTDLGARSTSVATDV